MILSVAGIVGKVALYLMSLNSVITTAEAAD